MRTLARWPSSWAASHRLDSRASRASASLGATVSKSSGIRLAIESSSLLSSGEFLQKVETDAMLELLETNRRSPDLWVDLAQINRHTPLLPLLHVVPHVG